MSELCDYELGLITPTRRRVKVRGVWYDLRKPVRVEEDAKGVVLRELIDAKTLKPTIDGTDVRCDEGDAREDTYAHRRQGCKSWYEHVAEIDV